MPKLSQTRTPPDAAARVRRGYFECRYGQLHLHNAMPSGGGFEEGTALLCIQDLEGSARIFANLLAISGCDRSVYAPDLPGFGESDPPPGPVALADYALALGDFIDTMRLRTLAVLAVRRGVMLATELALARPAQVSRLMMLGVPPLDPAARRTGQDGAADPTQPQCQAWAMQAALAYPLRERLAKITQPLALVRAQDEPAQTTARLRELVPTARIVDLMQPAGELLRSPLSLGGAVREFLRVA
jgi:pimeloyl-ACP methyl ester carboxylesterase